MNYRLTKRARRDVLQIWRYIAEDSEAAADRFVDNLIQHFRILGTNPFAGRDRGEVRAGLRSFSLGDYLIFYRILGQTVLILHVVHGRRDLIALLRR